MTWYHSVTAIQRYSKCGELYRIRKLPDVRPEYQFAATVIGIAVHDVIRQLHANPALDIRSLVEQCVEMQEVRHEESPVRWGERQYSREGRTEKAVRIVTGYWHHNSGLDVRKAESWFWFDIPIPGEPEPIRFRGKLDQLVAVDGKLIINELKSSDNSPDPIDLRRNIQLAVEYYALKHGYIALDDDLPYIPQGDIKAHIHEWEPDVQEGIYRCKFCSIRTQRLDRYPDAVQYVDLAAYDPGKKEFESGNLEPKRQQPPPLYCDSDALKIMLDTVVSTCLAIRQSERTGVWPRNLSIGYGSACGGCRYQSHCTHEICKPVRGE